MRHKPALKVEQLAVHYDKSPVLWDLNFQIPEDKIVGIIGPNGAGKSTLLKAILGLIKTTTGNVEFFGQSLKNVYKDIAYVSQRASLDWDFPISVLDVVLMGRYHRLGLFKWIGKKDKEAAKEALKKVGMEAFADRQISKLSGGQQQRVVIARALAQEAKMYIMDEPFAGVDMATEKAIFALMKELKHQGKTLLIVHHDLNTVQQYFDWVVLLNTCLIANGPASEVFDGEHIQRAYGRSGALFEAAKKLTQEIP